MLKDLVLNFAILGVFLFLVSPLFIRGRTRRTNKLVHRLIIGGVFGVLGIILTFFGIDINGSAQLNLRGIALMLAAYFAGPAGALADLAVVYSWRLAENGYLDAAQVGIGMAAAVGTGLLFQKIRPYFLKWLCGTLFLLYFYYGGLWLAGQISWGTVEYYLVYQTGFSALISVFLYYLERNEANKSKAIQTERDMSSMLRMQPGFTFRFQKRGGKYYYTMIEGRLLQRIGAAPADFIGRSVEEVGLFPRDYIELLNNQYDEAWEGTEVSHERLFNDLILHVNLHPIRTDGVVTEVIGTGIDITEEKRRLEADESNKAKSRFLAQMSHEIRTPINAIIGLNYILQQSDLSEKQLDYVNKSITAAKSLLAIVNDVLDFSKIEANKVVLENIEFDLYEVLHNLSNMVSFKAYEKGLKFRFSIDPQVPQMLIGDPYRLQQILLNITNNAVKFTNSGELAISVHCGEQVHGMTQVKFVVRDTGIGMTKEQLEGLFREFTQADMTTTRRFGGTGLGLVISKRLAEMMGGAIRAESRPGQGSTFEIALPLASADASVYGEEFDQALSFVRVLLVCSDLQMQWVLRRQLTQFKFVVNVANGAVDVLDKLDRGESYDMVIVDWKLKGEDPLTLAQAIRGRGLSEQPSVVLVSSCHESELQQALQSGCVSRALLYPISQSQLYNELIGLVQWKTMYKQQPSTGRSRPEPSSSLKDAVVLLAEDNEINQLVAVELLKAVVSRVDVADDGFEAVELATRNRYDVILMDLQMPEMDGYEAVRQIRQTEAGRNVPIIAMTADAMKGVEEQVLAVGMDAYLTKPFDPLELYKMLHQFAAPSGEQEASASAQAAASADGGARLDIEGALKRLGGNDKLYEHILELFVADHANGIELIRSAMADGAEGRAERHVHSLKGVAANIGATGLADLMDELQAALRSGDRSGCDSLLSVAEREMRITLQDAGRIRRSLTGA
ncbi:hypothetical protein B1A99_09830 [Cohnella sp. CIP 111063]|uniref:hybrid sensor histidine kinase/response regulator n=1 Tax=unclassified Cohnella TaxID=2636738 RepID=UPI000B8C1AFC|nr:MULTISPECIES: response regulator [unclassified Cohnella]OXS59830.1 hypothetical protein B1A99_09830 [Cohnella sp. CIP 111063]PRX72624.1 signal transduction histidine kinase [Cohnella sp. SGD-V74]